MNDMSHRVESFLFVTKNKLGLKPKPKVQYAKSIVTNSNSVTFSCNRK